VSSRKIVPITRELIVRTAAERLAADGLAGVTLRRIATELGVSAPTLLWHIKSKRELLDSVASHLLREARTDFYDRPREGQPWWEWLEERTRWMYRAMVSLRDAPLVVAGNRPTQDMLPGTNQAIGVLVEEGFSAEEALQAFFVLGGYIGGMALETQAESAREEPSGLQIGEDLPYLLQASAAMDELTPAATFDYGLALLIRGLRARHAELQ
jgi:TetR/AcrR family tetracycline transcriptional repressor